MNEEKTLKHWLKRKASFTQSLLVVFLITGGISFAATLEELEGRIKTLEDNQIHYIDINSSKLAEDGTTVNGNYNNDRATGKDAIAIGINTLSKSPDSISIGSVASTGGSKAISIGKMAISNGEDAISIGTKTEAQGTSSISIGENAKSSDPRSISIGNAAQALGTSAIAMGNTAVAEKLGGIAFGWGAKSENVTATSIGFNATTTQRDSIAIGSNSSAMASSGVALGSNSIADRADFTSETIAPFSGTDLNGITRGAVSVGGFYSPFNKTYLRQIINLADGTEDTDAVNLRQLKGAAPKYFSVNSTTTGIGSNYDNDGAKNSGGVAIGELANATGVYSTAIGRGATSLGSGSISIGQDVFSYAKAKSNGISLEEYQKLTDEEKKNYFRYYRPGYPSLYYKSETASGNNVTIGTYAENFGERNVTMGQYSKTEGKMSVALGASSTSGGIGATAVGFSSNVAGKYSTALGYQSKVAGDGSISLGRGAGSAGNGLISIGQLAFSTDTTENTFILPAEYNKKSAEDKMAYVPMYNDAGTPIKYYKSEKSYLSASSIAIGNYARSFGLNNVVLGTNAIVSGIEEVEKGEIRGGTALGFGAKVSAWNGVALGSSSVADRAEFKSSKIAPFSGEDLNGITRGAVSVGGFYSPLNKTYLRQIINLADGTEDTDAVNLRQLKGAVKSLNETIAVSPHYFSVNSAEMGEGSNYNNKGAQGKDSMAIGANAETLGNNSIALGDNVKNLGNESLAIGKNIGSAGTASTVIGIKALSVIAKEEDGISVEEYNKKSEEEKKKYVPLYGYGGPVKYYINDPDTNTAAANVVIGHYSRAFGQDNVAIGVNSLAKERGAVAVGFGSKALQDGAISLGISSTAQGKNSIAMGSSAKVAGEYSTGIGLQTTVASGYSIVMGYDSLSYGGKESEVKTLDQYNALSDSEKKEYIQYLGDYNYYKITPEGWNVVIGDRSKAFGQQITSLGSFTNVREFGGVALGTFSESNVERGVALGYYSLADRAAFRSETIAPFSGKDLNGQTMGAVSVGREGGLRQIINVGDATQDTDAVNLRQLQGAVSELNETVGGAATHFFSVSRVVSGESALGNYKNDGAKAIGAIAIGVNTQSLGYDSTGIGSGVLADGRSSVSIGYKTITMKPNSIAIGNEAKAEDISSIAIGDKSQSLRENAISIGKDSRTLAISAIAIGHKATASQLGGTAFGWGARSESMAATSIGFNAATFNNYAIAIGSNATSSGENAISFGSKAVTTSDNSIAIGNNSNATASSGVALGSESIANREGFSDSTPTMEITKGVFSNFELRNNTYGAISVGTEGKLRQIIHVGDATQDTDAVNLRQLKAVDEKITTLSGNVTNMIEVKNGKGIAVTSDTDTGGKKTFTVALDDATSKKIDSIGKGVVAEGNTDTVTGGTVFDYVKDQIGTATGNTMISYKADGETTSNKVTASEGFHFQGDDNIKISSAEKGVLNYTLSSNLSGIESISNGDTKVTLGKDKTVNFGESKLSNLAEGEVSATSTDAVTGAQLYKTDNKIDMLEKNSSNQMDAINKNAEGIANVKNEVGHVGSLSAALAALHPMQYDPVRPNQIMAGLGHYRDKQAVSVGVSHYFNENFMMTAGVSVGNENRVKTMANVGFTWKLGKEEDIEKIPERYQDGPIGSVYVMQQEMEAVLQENRSQKVQLQEQQGRIEKLEKQLELLLKKN